MTYFINLRGGDYGAVCSPYVLEGDPLSDPPAMASIPYESVPALVKGKDILLITHGFNVGYVDGLRSLGRMENLLAPTSAERVFGVLWPGDWIIPAINYPFEENIASHAGQLLGKFCNDWLSGSRSISFASHSLGARVVLQATAALSRSARNLCIMAGAVGADCLTAEYQTAAANCDKIVTLSSMEDMVLALAYPPGDLIADILDDDHKPFEQALGRDGPDQPLILPSAAEQIDDEKDYGHGDYLPPSDMNTAVPDPNAKWTPVADFVARVFRNEDLSWPSA